MDTTGPLLVLFGLPAAILVLAVVAYITFDRWTGAGLAPSAEEEP